MKNIKATLAELQEMPTVELTSILALVCSIAFRAVLGLSGHYTLLFILIALVGLISKRARQAPGLWLALTGLQLFDATLNYYSILEGGNDWMVAGLYMSLWVAHRFPEEAEKLLARNAQLVIGIVLLCAGLSKATQPEFINGNGFRIMFFRPTMQWLLTSVGGMTPEAFFQSQMGMARVFSFAQPEPVATIAFTPRLVILAKVFAFGVAFLETTTGLLFLTALKRLERARNVIFFVFLGAVYSLLPVPIFTYVFITLGIAQDRTKTIRLKLMAMLIIISALGLIYWVAGPAQMYRFSGR